MAAPVINLPCLTLYSMFLSGTNKLLFMLIICSGSTSYTRRTCQTVLAAHLLSIVRVIAPIVPHLAEDVWQNLPFQYTNEYGSFAEYVFESRWPTLNERWLALPDEEIEFWGKILEVHSFLNSILSNDSLGRLNCCIMIKDVKMLTENEKKIIVFL